MHKELEKVKDEYVEEILELTKDGISIKNVELVDVLTHTAKNLCKLIESDREYGRSRDSRGRYTSDEDWKDRMHRMEEDAPNEYVRRSMKQYGERMN